MYVCMYVYRDVSEELTKMRNKEKYMNNQFSTLAFEFKEVLFRIIA
jgi:hypothetical protein